MVTVQTKLFRCELEFAVDMIRGKWKVDIMCWLRQRRVVRFNELRRLIPGVSQRILARQLHELERYAIVRRKVHPEVPPRVEYSLTASGAELCDLFHDLTRWADRHIAANGESDDVRGAPRREASAPLTASVPRR
jgi:DNA-binding HxlR family transcriptional regulator